MLDKEVGETPLECLERERARLVAAGHREFAEIPMTYAGRLDPMAEGKLLILVGDECKEKEKYLGLDKEYEVEIVFGIATDTYDVLGIIKKVDDKKVVDSFIESIPTRYVDKFDQPYPPFSSKPVSGKPLFEHARANTLDDIEIPTKQVEIYSIIMLGGQNKIGVTIADEALIKIAKVRGDFRQKEIIAGWHNFQNKYAQTIFKSITLGIFCSSGTYMRSLAEKMGKDTGVGAMALSIKRIRISD